MPRVATKFKNARVEARIPPLTLAMVKRAAEIQGRSVSDFLVAAAGEVAERTIRSAQVIELSLEDQRRMYESFLNPPEPGPAWHRAVDTHRRLISESR